MTASTRSSNDADSKPTTNTQEDHQYQASNTTHREEDQWKHRPPYEIHSDNSTSAKPAWHGQCHCGRIKYQLRRERALAAKYCHCTTCQRLHGAPFQWAAIFHKTDIAFTHGHNDLGWYDPTSKSTTHHLPCKVSCAYCRAPIMDEGRNMILLFPGLVEEIMSPAGRDAFRATCHMFYNERVVDFKGDGATKFEGLDGKSNKLDDEGNVLDRWMEEKECYESELSDGKGKGEKVEKGGAKRKGGEDEGEERNGEGRSRGKKQHK